MCSNCALFAEKFDNKLTGAFRGMSLLISGFLLSKILATMRLSGFSSWSNLSYKSDSVSPGGILKMLRRMLPLSFNSADTHTVPILKNWTTIQQAQNTGVRMSHFPSHSTNKSPHYTRVNPECFLFITCVWYFKVLSPSCWTRNRIVCVEYFHKTLTKGRDDCLNVL